MPGSSDARECNDPKKSPYIRETHPVYLVDMSTSDIVAIRKTTTPVHLVGVHVDVGWPSTNDSDIFPPCFVHLGEPSVNETLLAVFPR